MTTYRSCYLSTDGRTLHNRLFEASMRDDGFLLAIDNYGVSAVAARSDRLNTLGNDVGNRSDPSIGELPVLRWKLLNLERLHSENPTKYSKQLETLNVCLDHDPSPKPAMDHDTHG